MIFHQSMNSQGSYNFNAVFYTDKKWEAHFHKNMELIYVLEGMVTCTINTMEETLRAGDFGLSLPYDIHSYFPHPGARYWVLAFSDNHIRYFSRLITEKTGECFRFRCSANVENYVRHQLIFSPEVTTMTLKSCLYAICEEYLRTVTLVDKKSKGNQLMVDITDYIRENHRGHLTLSQLAKRLGYDYHYMSRFFQNSFHMSFTDFVNIYRLDTALQLLEETNLRITEVACDSGFQTIRNFNTFFKQKMGISPSEYRKTLKK